MPQNTLETISITSIFISLFPVKGRDERNTPARNYEMPACKGFYKKYKIP
jgi:hypothetical protein